MNARIEPLAHGGGTLKRNLGLWAIVGLGLGFMTPTVIFDTFGTVADATNDAVPLAYLVALVVLMFTAVSYGRMSFAIPSAGSAYTYVRESISPATGFMAGWTALISYGLLPLVNCLIVRSYLEQLIPSVPSWIWVVSYCVVVTGIIYLTMRGTSNLNMILLLFSLVVMIVFVVMVIVQLGDGSTGIEIDPIAPFASSSFGAVLAGAAIVCFSFIGFDAVTMYAEEAKDPKFIPRAILYTVIVGGIIFLVAAYVTQLRYPDVSAFSQDAIDNSTLPSIADGVGGSTLVIVFTAAGFAATVASGLATHASVSRMLLVMGRNDVLPKRFFGYVSPKTHTPTFNVVLIGVLSFVALFFDLDFIASLIGFGALAAFAFVNLSVIAWFAVRKGLRKTPAQIVTNIVLPGIGLVTTVLLWLSLEGSVLISGFVWVGIGFVYLLFLTRFFRRTIASFDESEPVTGFNKVPKEYWDEN